MNCEHGHEACLHCEAERDQAAHYNNENVRVLESRIAAAESKLAGWRIIDTDNFGGDYPNESFVSIGIRSKQEAEVMADALNARGGERASRFFRVVEADYILQPGFEP